MDRCALGLFDWLLRIRLVVSVRTACGGLHYNPSHLSVDDESCLLLLSKLAAHNCIVAYIRIDCRKTSQQLYAH